MKNIIINNNKIIMKCILFLILLIKINSIMLGNGINLQPSYYNNGNVTFGYNIMNKYNNIIKTIRIEIEPDKITQAKNWIEEAINNKYNVIATYHKGSVLGSNNETELLLGAEWWVNNYNYLSNNNTNKFLINLMNEFGSHELTSIEYANFYNNAINIIRKKIPYNNEIIIDLSGWGQESNVAYNASTLINDNNIIFSMHIYLPGWNQIEKRYLNINDIDLLLKTNRPIIIGEFGFTNGNNTYNINDGVNVTEMILYAKSFNIPIIGWCWNGDGGIMNMVSPTWYENPISNNYIESNYFYNIYNLLL